MARTLITVPPSPKKGDVIEIRVLIQHQMETGFRVTSEGRLVPRDIIKKLTCRFNDGATNEQIVSIEMFPAIAANPYVAFNMVASGSGTLTFTWEGDNGFSQTETAALKVV
jgi:sulfur-oxidizing protein SoxZ